MVDDGMPLDRITNVYRDESEYLRLRSEGYGAVPNSAHNYGEAMDVHGAAGEWLKQYGPQYGWYLIDYEGSLGGQANTEETNDEQDEFGYVPDPN